jgi:hypothetical protein
MKMLAFSILDAAVAAYGPVFFAPTKGAAIRQFMDICTDQRTAVSRHPADYTLFLVGQFDDQVGELTDRTNEPLMSAVDAVQAAADSQPPLPLEHVVDQKQRANGSAPVSTMEAG